MQDYQEGAGGAFAPPLFLVSKSQTYPKFLTLRSRSLEKSRSAPPLFGPDGRPILQSGIFFIFTQILCPGQFP